MLKMDLLLKIIDVFQYEVETPKMYGAFHLLFLALIIVGSVFLTKFILHHDDKTYRTTILVFWLVMVVMEIYREVTFSASVTYGVVTWDYAWYQFPFQLCATPLYIFPLIAFLPEGRVREACKMYISTFALFGGLAVMLYPGDVLCAYLGINIQSLIHHGLQLIGGIITIAHNRENHKYENLYKGGIVFIALVAVAMVLNVTVHAYHVSEGMTDTFNMFFISPYFDCTLPVLSSIYPTVPYPIFLLTYIIGFAVVALIMFSLTKLIINGKEIFGSLWKKAKAW